MKYASIAVFLALSTMTANANESAAVGRLSVELNAVNQVEFGCQLTFVAKHGLPEEIESVVFETVLFETSGSVNRLTLFDFGAIPAGVPRVRQFVVPDLQCVSLGRLLINGVSVCSVTGLDEAVCAAGLSVTSLTDVEVLG